MHKQHIDCVNIIWKYWKVEGNKNDTQVELSSHGMVISTNTVMSDRASVKDGAEFCMLLVQSTILCTLLDFISVVCSAKINRIYI